VPDKEQYKLRVLLHHRIRLVKIRTMMKNKIHAAADIARPVYEHDQITPCSLTDDDIKLYGFAMALLDTCR